MRDKKWRLFLLGFGVICGVVSLVGQGVPNARINIDQTARFRNAANRWMLDPVDLKAQRDTTSEVNRRTRDQHWDKLTGQAVPLSQPSDGMIVHFDESARRSDAPEFPLLKNGLWITGAFESYRTYLSASERSVYTEVNIRVKHVFGHPGIAGLAPGALIDVGQDGGTIVAPWGGNYTYQVQPNEYGFQPGHTYLMLLRYTPDGNFYRAFKRWDLTTGQVQPEGSEVDRARNGKSEIVGLDIPTMTKFLDKKFSSSATPLP